ncbi:MAG: cell division protein ZapE [Frankiaceae bacterium]
MTGTNSLVARSPSISRDDLVAGLVPPPRFAGVRFETYRPDPAQPSQQTAVNLLRRFAGELTPPAPAPRRGWLGRFGRTERAGGRGADGAGRDLRSGVYLDGGFGVGKTHLLASLWHVAPRPKAYLTLVELTSLVGALGFATATQALSGHRLLAVDEFELDDPGDTVLVSTLLTKLAGAGVRFAATSNTQPEDLGEDRFAAADFFREIQGLAAHFVALRVDGEDYRHRGHPVPPPPASDAEVARRVDMTPGATRDDFEALLAHLEQLHPSRYGALVEAVPLAGIHCVRPVTDQATALRLVVLVDRLYDRDVPVVASGRRLDLLFPDDFLHGPHRKKFQRAVSRLVALAREGVIP